MTDAWFVPPRGQEPEDIDQPDTPDEVLREAMHGIRNLNRRLGYHGYLLGQLERRLPRGFGGSLNVLDVATGLADVPLAFARWGRRRGISVQAVGLDLNPRILAMAQEEIRDVPEVELVEGDALAMPFPEGAFDVVTSHLALHHFPEERIAPLLQSMDRVLRPGGIMLVGDLVRTRPNQFLVEAACTLFGSKATLKDGKTSIRNAYSHAEFEGFIRDSGLDYLSFARPAYPTQVLLAGRKP
ncbi:Demethylmenaquinone methyltransferase [compost metagenome]